MKSFGVVIGNMLLGSTTVLGVLSVEGCVKCVLGVEVVCVYVCVCWVWRGCVKCVLGVEVVCVYVCVCWVWRGCVKCVLGVEVVCVCVCWVWRGCVLCVYVCVCV